MKRQATGTVERAAAKTPGRRDTRPLGPMTPGRGATALSEGAFGAMLHSEQACLDRHGHAFSLLTFETSRRSGASDDMGPFAREARALLRSTDLVGPLGTDKVQVLLPFADCARAHRVAAALLGDWSAKGITYEVECREPVGGRTSTGSSAHARGEPSAIELPSGIRWEQGGAPLLLCVALPRWKRALDLLLAGGGLLVLAPLMLLIALLIRVFHGGPVLYRQWRTGQGFRRFEMYKFRTMREGSSTGWEDVQHLNEMSGPLFKSTNDPRVLRFGKLLRKSSLDELPQLYNVLKGDMTLVGPRALSPKVPQYATWQLRRFDLVPGLACSWQAERRSDTDFDEWMRSDLRYVDAGYSFLGDCRLLGSIARTVLLWVGSR